MYPSSEKRKEKKTGKRMAKLTKKLLRGKYKDIYRENAEILC